jgi:DNA-directed RNA polymerase sigma subunit (sigma70/sigma32)
MADPRPHNGSLQDLLDDLVQRARAKAHEHGFITLEEIVQLQLQSEGGNRVNVSDVQRALETMGVKVGAADDEDDEIDDADDDEEDGPLALGQAEMDDEPRAPWLMPTAEENSFEPEHVEEVVAEVDYAPSEAPAAIYLRDISRVRLLTAEEEVSLAKQIEQGNLALERIKQLGPTSDERDRLEGLSFHGNEARRRLTEANLRLVVSVAR